MATKCPLGKCKSPTKVAKKVRPKVDASLIKCQHSACTFVLPVTAIVAHELICEHTPLVQCSNCGFKAPGNIRFEDGNCSKHMLDALQAVESKLLKVQDELAVVKSVVSCSQCKVSYPAVVYQLPTVFLCAKGSHSQKWRKASSPLHSSWTSCSKTEACRLLTYEFRALWSKNPECPYCTSSWPCCKKLDEEDLFCTAGPHKDRPIPIVEG